MKKTLLILKKMAAATKSVQLLLLFLLLRVAGAQAQAPVWQSAVALASNYTGSASIIASEVQGTAADANGNVFIVGSFEETMMLGPFTLTSRGSRDGFVAKWSSATSRFVWVQQIGGPFFDGGKSIAVSGTSIYVSGSFSGPAVLGPFSLTSNAPYDVFVAKLTDAGSSSSFAWATQASSSVSVTSLGMAANGSAVYLTGSFVGQGVFGTHIITTTGGAGGFVVRLTDLNTTARFDWAQALAGTGGVSFRAVAVQGNAVYAAGSFTGAFVMGTTSFSSAGNADGLVVKLTDTGTSGLYGWAKTFGGTGDEDGRAIVARNNKVYLSGFFSATAAFGATSFTSAGGIDGYVASVVDNGNAGTWAWARPVGGLYTETIDALAWGGNSLYVAGTFESDLTLGVPLTNIGGSDVFVARLSDNNSNSSVEWATSGGGNFGATRALGLAVGGTRVVVAGNFNDNARFGNNGIACLPRIYVGFLASLTDVAGLRTANPRAEKTFTCYPNPAQQLTTVRLPDILKSDVITLTLFDVLDRPLRRQITPSATTDTGVAFDLTGIPPGVYALRVQAGAYAATQKLVVE